MLASLVIRNVVLIEHLEINFQGGFCALTGETGAGKSILLDSLGLALGARSDSSLIRKGADQASVTASFDIEPGHAVHAVLKEHDLDSDTTLVLRRVLGADGRSRAFVNDQPVGVSLLRDVGQMLVEIHSQFETHGLLDPKTHRALLDEYAGLSQDTKAMNRLWDDWKALDAALDEARKNAEKARADEDYLRHAVAELETLDPQPGEEEALLIRRETLKNQEQVLRALDEAWQAISSDQGAEMSSARAARSLERVADKLGADISSAIDALDRAGRELQEAVSTIQSIMTDIDDRSQSMEDIEDRLYGLRGIARKHHCTADDLPGLLESLSEKLSLIGRGEDILSALEGQTRAARTAYITAAQAVHKARAQASIRLDQAVATELPPLKLDKARFSTQVQEIDDETRWGPDGCDRVQFMVATNPGAEPGSLGKIASGGEMSRIMLAIKVVMAALGNAGTLIFDEVDSGIGGSTADAVGERLARLAGAKQILVVTHSPQVAARAAHHWIVMKDGAKDVRTNVVPLSGLSERQEEIARMLAGATITREARAAAQKLLDTGT